MANTRVKVPATAKKGDIFEIRTLAQHPMESGYRGDAQGNPIPRKLLNRFVCAFNGRLVFEAKMGPSVSANPYFAFFARVEESGTFEFVWTGDDGSTFVDKAEIKVE